MKTRIAILLVILSGVASVFSQAQNAAGGAPPAGGAGAAEIIPSLTFGEDMPLAKIINDLAANAGTNIVIDPALLPTMPTNSATKLRFTDITALNALKSVVKNNGLVLEGDPETGVGRITKKSTVEPVVAILFKLGWANPTNVAEAVKATFKANNATAFPLGREAVMVSAIQREMDAITNMVAQMDTAVRQVSIGSKMLQTSKNPRTSKGIDWAGTLAAQGVSLGNGFTRSTFTASSPGAAGTTTQTLPGGRVLSTTTTGPSTSTSTLESAFDGLANLPGLSFNSAQGFTPGVGFLSADGARVVLSFLNEDADTEVISTPTAVTMDHEPTTLTVTRALPIFKFTPGSANVASGTDVTYTNLGTILNVTPHIRAGDNVLMELKPEVSSLDGQNTQVVSGQNNVANVYSIARIESKVIVPSGYTLVMGGLMSDRKTQAATSVPFFSKIPVLGLAFKKNSKTQLKENLLIFITPTIVKDSDFQKTESDFLKTPFNAPSAVKMDDDKEKK